MKQLLLAGALAILGFFAFAASVRADPPVSATASADMPFPHRSEEQLAFTKANIEMLNSMGQEVTGDADRDFVNTALPYLKGMAFMARIELLYGKDLALKAMAAQILRTNVRQVDAMESWKAGKAATLMSVPPPAPTPVPAQAPKKADCANPLSSASGAACSK